MNVDPRQLFANPLGELITFPYKTLLTSSHNGLIGGKYAALANSDLVGVVDVNDENAQKVAQECGTTGFTDYRELVGKIEAASIVVPTQQHFQVAKD